MSYCIARSWHLRPISRAFSGFSHTSRMRAARVSALPCGKRRPAPPTRSRMPSTSLAIIGFPEAIPSSTERDIPSCLEESTTASAAARRFGTSDRTPRKWTRRPFARALHSSIILWFSGVSAPPARKSWYSSGRRSKARMSVCWSFSGRKAETMRILKPSCFARSSAGVAEVIR